MLDEFLPLARAIAARLVERGETIAVADGATAGLISASLLAIPGASKYYRGGGVVYTFRARNVLFALDRSAYEGMVSATESYALLQARAIRDNFRADWGIAETGSAGGSPHPLGIDSGRSCAAVAGPAGVELARLTATQSDDRVANMAAFTRAALELLDGVLAG